MGVFPKMDFRPNGFFPKLASVGSELEFHWLEVQSILRGMILRAGPIKICTDLTETPNEKVINLSKLTKYYFSSYRISYIKTSSFHT